ncbi:MAG: hypothetical protein HQL48_05375 [Gammaproteobacteria bacterium]|nr:hypothetical protein [Gammaproteobacteria bacterium]
MSAEAVKIPLPRGGVIIRTSIGNLQFAAPPETIKDSMGLEGGVPTYFIIPQQMYALHKGIALADLEFPVYFNFFIKKRKTVIICNQRQGKALRGYLSEALFGPEAFDLAPEYPHGAETPGFPDLATEMASFSVHPQSGAPLCFEDLIEFRIFDDNGSHREGAVEITIERDYTLRIGDGGEEIATVPRAETIVPGIKPLDPSQETFAPPPFRGHHAWCGPRF